MSLVSLLGMAAVVWASVNWYSPDLFKFAGLLTIAAFSFGARITVPGAAGSLPLTFVFVLVGVLDLTGPETIVLAGVLTLGRCLWNQPSRPQAEQVLFNVAIMALGAVGATWVYHAPWMLTHQVETAIRLAAATVTLFVVSTLPIALAIALAEGVSVLATWRECCFWSIPYYVGGAAIAQAASFADRVLGWQTVLLIGPVVYLVYRSYRLYVSRLENEKKHAKAVAGLHLRTIEALALAIEAKDHTTHDHLARVQIYAQEIGRDLGLTHDEMEALRTASLLHDIGKLAVPEHIISKPGRLTPEEFEKMKIHPIVGAEILERVQFPYPVVPIVRAHHERWNGAGYPNGLKGEDIPIGARILAVVDCLDALATDRQYRKALPLDEAMKVVQGDSGTAFDPRVVEVLSRRYVELEKLAKAQHKPEPALLSTEVKVTRGIAPAAGFEKAAPSPVLATPEARGDFLSSIAAARQEVQALFEIAQDLGNSLSVDETLSVLGVRLRRIVPHDALVIWVKRDLLLIPEYVSGEDYRLFSTLEIPIGQGLSGWVAENRKPVLNGNPSVEPGYMTDASRVSTLRSAVAVPLEGVSGVVGVLTLYHSASDAFTKDHLRILLATSSKIGLSIENALRFRQAECSATTDYLTSLPNARSLFLQLDEELSKGRRDEEPLAVIVLDLDGFKQINDRYGHIEGNRVLRAVGNGLKAACRKHDYVARMGGDEFVILLPGLGPHDIETRTAQLRAVVSNVCRERFSTDTLTASVGAAHFPQDGADAEQILSEADRRMYKEKAVHRRQRPGIPPDSRRTPEWNTSVRVH
ncbi:MAG TPA: HD domain-containing phosphohydrolase [Bryobacteraceae bacterium]|nr:HD domain-containing phosphohydrolase [Bryobacteraceae bacterium]